MGDVVQANLKPKTIERIQKITDKPVTRGLDKMINECFDKLETQSCQKNSKTGENQEDE